MCGSRSQLTKSCVESDDAHREGWVYSPRLLSCGLLSSFRTFRTGQTRSLGEARAAGEAGAPRVRTLAGRCARVACGLWLRRREGCLRVLLGRVCVLRLCAGRRRWLLRSGVEIGRGDRRRALRGRDCSLGLLSRRLQFKGNNIVRLGKSVLLFKLWPMGRSEKAECRRCLACFVPA